MTIFKTISSSRVYMEINTIVKCLFKLTIIIVISVQLGNLNSYAQADTSKKQDTKGFIDLSKYAVAEYDSLEAANPEECEKRKLKNKRYDNQQWVKKRPHPETGKVGRFDEIPPPPLFPSNESNLVIVGQIVSTNAYLSNDKSGVYSEFTVLIKEVFKNDATNMINKGNSISADRTGGFVRYPNGQKVFYENSTKHLPQVGSEYVLFLRTDKASPNYEILTGYELKDGELTPLNNGRRFDEFKGMTKQTFIESVRNQVVQSSKTIK
jgi:hypothetical protein